MDKPKLYVLVGLSGSGKSTLAAQLAESNENTVIVSSDAIREELTGKIEDQSRNNEVFEIFYQRIRKNLEEGKNAIADATNLLIKSRLRILNTAPASTRFHSCHESGLLEHSLNVFHALTAKKTTGIWQKKLKDVADESLAICALLHDLCKTYFYITDYRNKKNEQGIWERVPYYTIDDKIPYGHGEKSVMMIEEYIKLLPVERYAIRWHMGWTEPKENYNALGIAMEKYPLILALHEADLEATYLMEEKQ